MDATSPGPTPPLIPGPSPTPPATPWPVSAQTALILILVAGIFFLLGRLSQQRPEAATVAPERAALDLNRATHAELRLLPGVGDSLAERIVDHRRQHGSFRKVDDLRQVSGVGPKTLDRLRPRVAVMPDEEGALEPLV